MKFVHLHSNTKTIMKKTKIVATISDFRCETEFLRKLFFAGMNVVRINTAHAGEESIRKIVTNVRQVSPHIAIMLDTKGPEVRTTFTPEPIEFKLGERVVISGDPNVNTSHEEIHLSYRDIAKNVKVGDELLFDDGEIDLKIIENNGVTLIGEVQNDGMLGSRKSVNAPGEHIDLPAVTERDRQNILLAIELDIDFIAHSFVRSAADVGEVQKILDEHNSQIKIISKIENQEGVDNIDEILDVSYGIMIARGDLGIEVPQEKIPGIQRQLIRKCVERKKPVIVATQMLHSMIKYPRPTRAEVTDIANAIYSNTDALMLSGETANGKYPLEAVQTMARIAEQAEQDRLEQFGFELPLPKNCSQKEFLAHSAIDATRRLGVAGIIADSETGEIVRMLAAFRGPTPILAICYREKTHRLLNLSYGVIPIYQHKHLSSAHIFMAALRMLKQKGYVTMNDKIAYLSGNLGLEAGTTFLEINPVKKVFENIDIFHLPYAEHRVE